MSEAESSTIGSIEPSTKQKKSRKEYLKQWRLNNPEKVREHKRNYYSKHEEQERERARKLYHKNKNNPEKGKSIEKFLKTYGGTLLPNISYSTYYRTEFVIDYGSAMAIEEIEKRKSWKGIEPIYDKVRREYDSCLFRMIMRADELGCKYNELSNDEFKKIRDNYTWIRTYEELEQSLTCNSPRKEFENKVQEKIDQGFSQEDAELFITDYNSFAKKMISDLEKQKEEQGKEIFQESIP